MSFTKNSFSFPRVGSSHVNTQVRTMELWSISSNASRWLANERYPGPFLANHSLEVISVKFNPAPVCLTSKVFGSQAEDKEI